MILLDCVSPVRLVVTVTDHYALQKVDTSYGSEVPAQVASAGMED